MILKKTDGMQWYQFEIFSDFKKLHHGVFTRKGGYSSGSYESLNFSYHVGDDPITVSKNYEKVSLCWGLNQLIKAKICHGDRVLTLDEISQSESGYDGVATNKKNIGLVVTHADCQAAIFFDPITESLAVVHCGWRSNVLNIYEKTVALMKKSFGAKTENIRVGISPSLGPNHAEFIHYKIELPKHFHRFNVDRNIFNLWDISQMQLENCGILKDHIEIAKLCTYEQEDSFFSYRREKICGRNATFAVIKK